MKLKKESEDEGSQNVISFKERKKSNLLKRERNIELAESGEKNKENKIKKRKLSVERKTKKHKSFFARNIVVKNVLYANNTMQNSIVVSLLKD